MNLRRHLPALALEQRRRAAISEFETPSPAQSTSLARDTSPCGRLRESANPLRSARSSALNSRSGLGRTIDKPKLIQN
jgi:hypothetical protein